MSLAGFPIYFALQAAQVHATALETSSASECLLPLLEKIVQETEQQAVAAQPRKKIETLDDLLIAFTEGLEPDLSVPKQRDAFEIYRKMRFGDPNTSLNSGTLDQIAKELKRHPELKKEPFRNFRVEYQERVYAVTENLTTFLDSQVRSAGQVRSNLFQVEANKGYWKKIFRYEVPAQFLVAAADKAAKKILMKEADAHFDEFLSVRVSKETQDMLANNQIPVRQRAQKLYDVLMEERVKLQNQGKDTRPISQAIVDLVHTIGYHDPAIVKGLKSADGLERLKVFHKVLQERDAFAIELGYENHFDQVLKDFNIPQPTGVASIKGMAEKLLGLEDEVVASAQVVKGSSSTKTIRHLSLAESPFRSCLGGSDCSSRTYLTRALDPSYHYFTITDEQGFSTGHITVVLGEVLSGEQKIKVGFVDKVQNVDNVDLPVMIEGVRRSLEEKGYTLVLPENLGDHNGISNESVTRSFIERNISVDEDRLLTSFKPNSHSYNFENAYSRADQGLPVRPVLPLKQMQGIEISAGGVATAWKISDFNLEKLIQASIRLKKGGVEDKIRYISSMKTIKTAGLKGDPEFKLTLDAWLHDSSLPFRLRKQVLLTEWVDHKKPISMLLSQFSREEQITLIQNFLDTPRYRKVILAEKKELPNLIVRVRESKKVRDMLIAEYSPHYREPIGKILDTADVDAIKAVKAIKQVESSFASTDVDQVVQVQRTLQGTSLEPWLQEQFVSNYMSNIHGNAALGRGLSAAVSSADPILQTFGLKLLSRSSKEEGQRFPILHAYREILEIRRTEGSVTLHQAAESWLQKEQVDPILKAEYVMTMMGASPILFDVFLGAIPESQRATVVNHLDRNTSIGVFRRLAKRNNVTRTFFDHAILESLQFQSFNSSNVGVHKAMSFVMGEGERTVEVTLTRPFEMQRTPMTQLLWVLVMGKNPSKFTDEGIDLMIGGKKIKVDVNRPVEASWNEVQTFIERLNKSQNKYVYRLPTEAEWEFAARGGTSTKFFYGDDADGMRNYGWTHENSGNKTHPVAELRPNPKGLYDMYGNVMEWTQDYYDDLPTGFVTDPTGPTTGSTRVIRGGSWNKLAEFSSSSDRNGVLPEYSNHTIGFRLVRTPK